MSGKRQVPKTTAHLLSALEDHLSTLVPMLEGLQKGDAAHVKDIAAKLRLLICGSSGQKGLLWEIAEATEADDKIDIRYGGPVDAANPLARGLQFIDNHALANLPGTPIQLESISLRQHIVEHEAAFVDGASLTYLQLIKEMAEHSGTAHETPGVSRAMAKANAFRTGDVQPFIPILDRAARWTLTVGEKVIDHAVSVGMARVRPESVPPPEVRLDSVRFSYPLTGPALAADPAQGTVFARLARADFLRAKEFHTPFTFPPLASGTVVVTFQATRRGRLRVRATGLAIPNFTHEREIRAAGSGDLAVAVTWSGPEIAVLVDGERAMQVLDSPFEPASS